MSNSMNLKGVKPPTEDYKKKLAAYLACQAAGVEPPPRLVEYFDGIGPESINHDGIEVSLYNHPAVLPYKGKRESGFDVDLAKLPDGVTILRVYENW